MTCICGLQSAWHSLKAPWHEKWQPQTVRNSISCHWLQVEKDEEYIKSIAALGGKVEELVKANNAIDIYQEYFSGRVSCFPSLKEGEGSWCWPLCCCPVSVVALSRSGPAMLLDSTRR